MISQDVQGSVYFECLNVSQSKLYIGIRLDHSIGVWAYLDSSILLSTSKKLYALGLKVDRTLIPLIN